MFQFQQILWQIWRETSKRSHKIIQISLKLPWQVSKNYFHRVGLIKMQPYVAHFLKRFVKQSQEKLNLKITNAINKQFRC